MRKLVAGAVLFILLVLFSILFSAPSAVDTSMRLLPPSSDHLFGTDGYGRDLLAVTASGIKTSLIIGMSVTSVSMVLGIMLSFCFSHRRFPKAPFILIADSFKSVPAIIIALFLNAVSGPGVVKIIVALSAANIPNIARTSYARAPVLRNDGYSMASEAQGAGEGRIFLTHILPHIAPYLLLQGVSIFSASILAESSLSYLGCGVPVTLPSLGRILSEARPSALTAWWMIVFPAAALLLLGLSLEMAGRGVSELYARSE